ncbi:MAG: C40 family peptidase [Lysobacter sp.]
MKQLISRQAAAPRLARARNLFLACLLATAATPAFAQQANSVASASVAVEAPALMPDAMTLPDRALMVATDINSMLVSGKTSAVAEDYKPTDGKIKTVLQKALTLLGTPYRWGGTSPEKGFDCSGLVSYVFRNSLGIELPRVSRDQAQTGELVQDKSKLNVGDLVFFGRRGRVDHVGIYVGEGRFVHAPSSGKDVMVSDLDSGYWSRKYMQARRVAGI